MLVYISMIALAILFSYLFSRTDKKKNKIIYFILTMLPFIIVSAIRYDVGTDYFFRYVPNYNTFVEGGTVDSLEILFRAMIRLCICISDDYIILFAITSIIINTLIISAIFKFSKNVTISIMIYFCASFYFESMNIVRQFISMAIIFASYKLLFKKRTILLWGLCIITATLFHTMSIVFVIAILLDKKVIDYKILAILIILIVFLGKPIIDSTVSLTANSTNVNIAKYARYLERTGDLPISTIVIEVGVYIYLYLLYKNALKNGKEKNKELIFFINMQSITLLFTVMNIHLDLFFRIASLFSIFKILSIPYFYYINKDCNWKVFDLKISLNNKLLKVVGKWNLIFCICVILALSAKMIFSNVIKGSEEVLPYKTIFSRNHTE